MMLLGAALLAYLLGSIPFGLLLTRLAGLGVWLALAWPVGLAACATWLVVAALARYSSLASLIAIAIAPLYALVLADRERAALGALLAILIVLRHHENIRRLVSGREPKIGQRA